MTDSRNSDRRKGGGRRTADGDHLYGKGSRIERRAVGVARPDRYLKQSKLSRRYVAGATVVILIALTIGFAGMSTGYWSRLETGEAGLVATIADTSMKDADEAIRVALTIGFTGTSMKNAEEAIRATKEADDLALKFAQMETAAGSNPSPAAPVSGAGTASPAPATSPVQTATLPAAPSRIFKSGCPRIPDVEWWPTRTHRGLIEYVNQKHDGNWAPYTKKWENQMAKLEDIYQRDGSAVLRKGKISLRGEALKEYIVKVGRRVEVIRCLAKEKSQ